MEIEMQDSTAKIVGYNLRNLRKIHGFTQKVIADELGVSFQQVQKYETGQNKLPIENLLFLKKFYNVTFDTFFSGLKTGDGRENEKTFIQAIDEKLILKRFVNLKNPKTKTKVLRLIDIMIIE